MDYFTPGPTTFPPRDLNHSVPLEVSLTSEDGAIAGLAQYLLTTGLSETIRKGTARHLELVLVNLYAAWEHDPKLSLAVSMTNSGYKARSRYNPLKASNQIIEVIGHLARQGYIHGATGFQDRNIGVGRNTRVWPSARLIGLFQQASLRKPSYARARGTEVVVVDFRRELTRDFHREVTRL